MSSSVLPDDHDALEALLRFIAQAAIDDVPAAAFLRTFQTEAESIAPAIFGRIDDPSARRAAIGQFGRIFWSAMPQPRHGWHAVPLPKPERNSPCPCGTGRKYKQCCQPYEAPPDALPQLNLLRVVLDLWPEAKFDEIPLRRLDPEALADTAAQWLDEGRPESAIDLLEPLFDDPSSLDDRHIRCFDELCDAYLDAGIDDRRAALVARVGQHRNKHLAGAALQRAALLATDAGDFDTAWAQFGRALRLTPDEPSLAHLELTLLRAEGRRDEAMARAKVWAARFRRMDLPENDDLVRFFEETAVDPERAMLSLAERNRPEGESWTDLLEDIPEPTLHYAVETKPLPEPDYGPRRHAVAMRASTGLAQVERAWRNRFFVQKPELTSLFGDAVEVCDDFIAVAEFMRANPLAWQSFEILDDLVLIACDWFHDGEEAALSVVLLDLTAQALELLRTCVAEVDQGTAIVEWAIPENRPPLRLVAQRIAALGEAYPGGTAEGEIENLRQWMLELNPHDNHGYRNPAMQAFILNGEPERAIALAARYPVDIGDLPFDLALALFQCGRKDEAAEAWARGAASTPLLALTLLALDPGAPAPETESDGLDSVEVLGGSIHAWRYRALMLDAWAAGGALEWARTLPTVAAPARRKRPLRRRLTDAAP